MKLLPLPKHWLERIAEDPNGEFAKKALKIQAKIDTVNAHQTVLEKIENKSSVGTRLKEIFRARVGAVPCSRCKRAIEALNKSPLETLLANKEIIVETIYQNSKEAKASFWAKLLMAADDITSEGKATKFMIARWFDEACKSEELGINIPEESSNG